jgi:hypothetical protein
MGNLVLSFDGEFYLQVMLGISMAILGLLIGRYIPRVPNPIQVLPRLRSKHWLSGLISAYAIALVFQLATSPFFATQFRPIAAELAWSPIQAAFNLIGVFLVDLVVLAVRAFRISRDAAQRAGQQVREKAGSLAAGLNQQAGELFTADKAPTGPAAEATADQRKSRLDERFKDH